MWFPSGHHISPLPGGVKIWTHPVPWIMDFFLSVMSRDQGDAGDVLVEIWDQKAAGQSVP